MELSKSKWNNISYKLTLWHSDMRKHFEEALHLRLSLTLGRKPHTCEAVSHLWGSIKLLMQHHTSEAGLKLWGSLIVVRQLSNLRLFNLIFLKLRVYGSSHWCWLFRSRTSGASTSVHFMTIIAVNTIIWSLLYHSWTPSC